MVENTTMVKTNNLEVIKPKYKAKYNIEDGYSFYKFIDAISKMIDEIKVVVKKDKICMNFMDPSRITLANIEFMQNWNNTITIDEIGDYHINIEDFAKILKVLKNDKKSFSLKFNDIKIIVDKKKQNGFKTTKTLNLIDLEIEEIPIENLLEIDYPSMVKIQKEFIEDLFKETGDYSEILDVTIDENGISFSESGQIGEGIFQVKNEYLDEIEYEDEQKGSYSLSFLSELKHLLSVMDKKQLITIKLKNDTPIQFTTEFEKLGITFNRWYAPRVEETEFDEDDLDEY